MRIFYKTIGGIFFLLVILSSSADAQYASRKLSKKQQAYIDSLKQVEYNYIFPILGQKAYSNGFDIPYPVGLMGNFYATNFRPDIWIFPFLNVYGLFGYGSSTTEVNIAAPVEMKSVVAQNMSTTGVGVMGAFGLGPLWLSVDANWTWTKPELLEDPVKVKVLGLRLGKSFVFKSHPERNFAIWAGGMRARMGSSTVGEIKMSDAIPQETWDRVDEIVDNYYVWYNDLDPGMKVIVDNTPFPDFIDALDSREGNTIVRYGMDKRPAEEWSVVVGGQFQVNKHWQIRTEGGIIGDRKSFLASVNYRFKI